MKKHIRILLLVGLALCAACRGSSLPVEANDDESYGGWDDNADSSAGNDPDGGAGSGSDDSSGDSSDNGAGSGSDDSSGDSSDNGGDEDGDGDGDSDEGVIPSPTDGTAGTAPTDDVAYSGTLRGLGTGYHAASLAVDGASRMVGVYVPTGLPEYPPLVIAMHGTGSNPNDFLDEMGLRGFADDAKVIVIAPQALERNGGMGEMGDPDHWYGSEASWGTSWNLGDDSPTSNNDLRLVRAIIQEARTSLAVDSDRVYTFGHSNGAFFAYHAAAVLSNRIAGFAENAGGAVRCANRGTDENQFVDNGSNATTCAALAAQSGYPTCSGEIQPIAPGANGRIPWGFLAHHNDDDVVSVSWTCTLAAEMGSRGSVFIKDGDSDSFGHSVVTDFTTRAWAYLSQHDRTE